MEDQDRRNGPTPVGKPENDGGASEGEPPRLPMPVAPDLDDPSGAEGGRRPTPVRMAMGDEEGEEDDGREDLRVIHDEESGLDWIVTVSGRSASGILPLRTTV